MRKKITIFLSIVFALLIIPVTVLATNPNLSLQDLIDKAKPVLIVNQDPIPVSVVNASPNPTPSPIIWEYTTDCFSNWDIYSSGLPARLNTRAGDGWKLVSTLQFQSSLACEYWKRPISQ